MPDADATPAQRFAWERAVMAAPLPRTRKLVLLTLATFVNRNGIAFPTQVQLASACGMQERAIRKHLAAAIEEKWIERVRVGRSGVASEYRLKLSTTPDPTGTAVPPPTGTDVPLDESQAARNDTQPAPACQSTGTGVPTNTYQHVDTTLPPPPPLNIHLAAIKFGKNLAGVAGDEEAVERHWKADRTLSRWPGLLIVVTEHWQRAKGLRDEEELA